MPTTITVPPDDYDQLAARVQADREELLAKEQKIEKLEADIEAGPKNVIWQNMSVQLENLRLIIKH